MRHLRILVLAAITAAALMAFIGAGTASASKLCSTTSDPCPAGQNWPANLTLDWSLTPGTSAAQTDTEGESLDTCKESTMKWVITNAGSSVETVTGTDEETTFGSCTFSTKTLKLGKWEIHKIAGTSNGTVTSDGTTETTINVIFASCVYGVTPGTDLGEITEGKPPVLHINAVTEEFTGNALCPNTDRWTATYTLTSPTNTTLSVSSG